MQLNRTKLGLICEQQQYKKRRKAGFMCWVLFCRYELILLRLNDQLLYVVILLSCFCRCVYVRVREMAYSMHCQVSQPTVVGPQNPSVTCQNTQQPHQHWTLYGRGWRDGGIWRQRVEREREVESGVWNKRKSEGKTGGRREDGGDVRTHSQLVTCLCAQ